LISSRPALPAPEREADYALPFGSADQESSGGGMSLSQLMSILYAYRWYSLITMVALISLLTFAIKLLPKVYVATATLIVNYETKDPLSGRVSPAGETNTYIPTQIELMLSRVVLQPVVDRLKLTADKEFTNGFVGPPAALNEVVTKNLHDKKLSVQQGMNSQLLYISASSKSPNRAAALANAVADEYLAQAKQRANAPAGERAELYATELAELRAKTIAAQDRLTEFRQQHAMTEVDSDKVDVEGAGLIDLQAKLQDAQNQRRQLEARQVSGAASSDAVLESPAVQTLRGQLAAQEAQMAELRTTLGPKHPKVIELDSQTAATRRSLAAEVHSISANNSVQLARARDLEAKYQNAVNTERTRLLGRRGIQDQSAKLVLELQSAQATYKKALDGYDQIVFASAGNNKDVSLVSRADLPVKADKPNKLKLFLVACMASLGVGMGWPFAYEMLLNRRLRCRDDLERHFGIPVLAQLDPIPNMSS
jgi:protein tyrosine kinase modulator